MNLKGIEPYKAFKRIRNSWLVAALPHILVNYYSLILYHFSGLFVCQLLGMRVYHELCEV